MSDSNQSAQMARLWMDAQPSVLSFICAVVPRFHDAEDILQEVAVDVATNFERYDAGRPFVAWAIGIARNKIAAHYRGDQRRLAVLSDQVLQRVAEAHAEQHAVANELRVALEECLDELAPKARSVIRMRYGDELASDAIASELHSTSGSVRVMLTRIRTQLSDCMHRKTAEPQQP